MDKKAFTLAEVLITLGIIGVVAAMTIPTLIANTNSLKFRSQFKKSISTLNQAVRSNIAHYDFDFASSESCSPGNKSAEEQQSVCAIFQSNLSGATYYENLSASNEYFKDLNLYKYDIPTLGSRGNEMQGFVLADGSIVGFGDDIGHCSIYSKHSNQKPFNNLETALNDDEFVYFCVCFIDVNGSSLPNKEVTCSDGTKTKLTPNKPCIVKNDANHMTDIYPIVFYDHTVAPATNAAAYVLHTAK